jgi:hypothetical protein
MSMEDLKAAKAERQKLAQDANLFNNGLLDEKVNVHRQIESENPLQEEEVKRLVASNMSLRSKELEMIEKMLNLARVEYRYILLLEKKLGIDPDSMAK